MSLSEEIREAGDWQGYSKMLAPVTLKGFADRVAELEKENALLLKADKVAELEQQVASLEEQLAVYISSEANEYGQSQQLIAKLQKQVASLEEQLAETIRLSAEKHRPAYDEQQQRIADLEDERDTLRTAIKQYLDCQTTNQWVVHFKKALEVGNE